MRMTKEQIADEIRRTARANGGKPFGERLLEKETGISRRDWQHYWRRLSDAHLELGFSKNSMKQAYPPEVLLERYAQLALTLSRLPTQGDLHFKHKNDASFPHAEIFYQRFEGKEKLVRQLEQHCRGEAGLDNVFQMCRDYTPPKAQDAEATPGRDSQALGYVYLIQHGRRREYKIGRTSNALRREGEIAIELPERVQPVHVITTDDPAGIEAYWHRRFADRRKNGEWFELGAADVAAFKRWKKIV